jgi:uncharacterized protein (UPF0303 family)
MTLPSDAQDLAELAAQEERLVFDEFGNDTAWELGVQQLEDHGFVVEQLTVFLANRGPAA